MILEEPVLNVPEGVGVRSKEIRLEETEREIISLTLVVIPREEAETEVELKIILELKLEMQKKARILDTIEQVVKQKRLPGTL